MIPNKSTSIMYLLTHELPPLRLIGQWTFTTIFLWRKGFWHKKKFIYINNTLISR